MGFLAVFCRENRYTYGDVRNGKPHLHIYTSTIPFMNSLTLEFLVFIMVGAHMSAIHHYIQFTKNSNTRAFHREIILNNRKFTRERGG